MDERYRHSLSRRLRAVHSLYYDATASMTAEQVNAVVVDGVLPIAFSLVHQVLIEDFSRTVLGGAPPLWAEPWTSRLALAIADDGKARSVEEMMAQRIGEYGAFCEFQRAVFSSTESFVDDIDPATFSDVVIAHPYPPSVASTFSARVGGSAGITRSDAIESWIYQHALRHMGEIEHARALVGLGGMTS
ncbi:MAG: hypothetical protein KGJ39_00035 [Acidobacteriota bacterium]|nr:hypothetical protein [Acidobacteriota bacterium]